MEFRAASIVDYAAMFPEGGNRTWRAARVQILSGPAWTLWRKGEREAICGLYPFHSGMLEAWLMLREDRRPGLAALRYLLDRSATVMPERTIIARIHDDNIAGHRLALLAGFSPRDDFLGSTRIRTWSRPGIVILSQNDPAISPCP